MSKFFHLSKRPAKRIRRQKLFLLPHFNLKTVNIALFVLVVVFGVSYLIQVNGLATKGYQIKKLEKKIVDLEQEKSALQLDALSLQSMDQVNKKLADLDMVDAGNSEYLREEKSMASAR